MSNKTGNILKGQLWVELEGVYTLSQLEAVVSTIKSLNASSAPLKGGSKEVTEDGV